MTVSVYAFSVLNLVFPSHLLAVVHDFSCPSGNLLRLVSDVVDRFCAHPFLLVSRRIPHCFVSLGWGFDERNQTLVGDLSLNLTLAGVPLHLGS